VTVTKYRVDVLTDGRSERVAEVAHEIADDFEAESKNVDARVRPGVGPAIPPGSRDPTPNPKRLSTGTPFQSARTMSAVTEILREDRDEFAFLAFIGLVVAWGIFESLSLTRESRLVPLIILALLVFVLVLTVVVKLLSTRYDLGIFSGGGRLDFEEFEEEGETGDMGIYDLNPRGVVKHFSWLVLYTLGLAFVGFWTTNVLFGVGYVLVNETSPIRKRTMYAVTSSAIILAALWVLFVELLKVQAIWRLGFLP
jgi:hypothetical protein